MTDSRSDSPDRMDQIGPYRLLQLLGEGGMGEVWLAEQTKPVHRRVALKVIKLGMDTKQVLARLDAERQALAVMDHPNIARFFDGGATETGRPYFVMELVQGTSITEYCDTNRLTVDERIRIFIDVCQAVQHAHHKGVVHRDLKPTNVLVTVKDNHPVVKIIDFGIAKALGQELTEKTLVTRMGQIIGTPEYMSPEQAEMTGLDLDTRTDVYSLGVILYELLVGALPFEFRSLFDQAIRSAIRKTDVPRPSTRLSDLGETQETIAQRRRTTAGTLRRELRSDLDWVILKAMEKDRTRRYETANGLALELERHLRNEPVLARAPTARYRVRKFITRHRVGVVSSLGAMLALVGGLVLATSGMVRAQRAEQRAEQEAEAARQVSDFLVDLFKVNDPSEARGNTITAREILDRGADRIRSGLGEQPVVRARLLRTVGEVFMSLGLYDEAQPMLESAVGLDREVLNPGNPEATKSTFELARLFHKQGLYAEAEPLYRQTLTSLEASGEAEDERFAGALNGLGNVLIQEGRYDEAEPLILRGLSIREGVIPPDSLQWSMSLEALGVLKLRQGDYETADSMFVKTLAVREAILDPNHPNIGQALLNLGGVRYREGKHDDAKEFWGRTLEIRREVLGPNHADLGDILLNLGVLAYSQKDYEGAVENWEQARQLWEAAYGPDNIQVAVALTNLARVHWVQGNLEESEALYRRALDIRQEVLDPSHASIASTMHGLASVYRDQGRFDQAEPLFLRALEIWESAPSPDPRRLSSALREFAEMLRETGREAEADSLELRAQQLLDGTGQGSGPG